LTDVGKQPGRTKTLVLFKNNVLQRFMRDVAGHEGFRTTAEQQAFLRSSPQDQLRIIKRLTGTKYQQDIELPKDPPAIRTFRKQVLPSTLRSCGTRQCHSSGPQTFRLHRSRKLTDPLVYTNFYLMDSYKSKAGSIIDRAAPRDSLLLTFGLGKPTSGKPSQRNAAPQHPIPIKPLFRSIKDSRYLKILRFIQSLDPVQPKYNLTIKPARKIQEKTPPPAAEAKSKPTPPAGR